MKRSTSALFIATVVALLYRKATRLWWTYDDAYNLHVSLSRVWTDPFTHADIWRQKLFTPLLFGWYEVLTHYAGLNSERWYAAQMALIALCGILFFFALRLYVKTLPAVSGSLLFVAGPAMCSIATQVMSVNYLIAIFFGALSLITFVLASRHRSNLLGLASAVFYFAAALAKEIAIPIPLLLLVLPERTAPVRARHLVFHGAAFAVYLWWRWSVIGTIFGGYGWAIAPRDIPALLASLPWKILAAWAGSGLALGLLVVGLVLVGVAWSMRTKPLLIAGLVTLFLAIAPIVPVSKEMQRRYVVPAWLWATAAFAVGVNSMKTNPRNALILASGIAVIVANRQEWTTEYAKARRMTDEARAYMYMDASCVLRTPIIPPSAMTELQWLKEEFYQRARGATWFYDDLVLCGSTLEGKRVFEYLAERRGVVEVTARIPDYARAWCASIRDTAAMRAEFHHRGENLFWRLGPYPNGRWTVVLADGVQAFAVPREDGFRLAGVPGLTLRIRYDSPQGWVTYSPELTIDFARQPDFVWQR